jgi:hypothetical protein
MTYLKVFEIDKSQKRPNPKALLSMTPVGVTISACLAIEELSDKDLAPPKG